MANVLRANPGLVLDDRLRALFGDDSDPMDRLEARARRLYPGQRPILWECDAATFGFTWVSASAEALLGHATERWLEEKAFWAE